MLPAFVRNSTLLALNTLAYLNGAPILTLKHLNNHSNNLLLRNHHIFSSANKNKFKSTQTNTRRSITTIDFKTMAPANGVSKKSTGNTKTTAVAQTTAASLETANESTNIVNNKIKHVSTADVKKESIKPSKSNIAASAVNATTSAGNQQQQSVPVPSQIFDSEEAVASADGQYSAADDANQIEVEGKEIASSCLQLKRKRFYFDVKENKRGRFIKIAEVGINGQKSRILFSTSAAIDFINLLIREFQNIDESEFSQRDQKQVDYNDDHGNGRPRDERLKSHRLVKDKRLYYIDLKENSMGRYLRCSQLTTSARSKSQITIPYPDLNDFLSELKILICLYEVDGDDFKQSSTLPSDNNVANQHQAEVSAHENNKIPTVAPISYSSNKSATTITTTTTNNNNNTQNEANEAHAQNTLTRIMKTFNRRYYFDVVKNSNGMFMKITEVKTNYRSQINLPEESWAEFAETFTELCNISKGTHSSK